MTQLVADITIAVLAITFLVLPLISWTIKYELQLRSKLRRDK